MTDYGAANVAATTGQAPAIVIRRLTKLFGPLAAVATIDLDIPAGSFFGLLGPNGAGKSTTLAMVTGLLRPTGGQIWVDGIDVWSNPVEVKKRIGVVPETLLLFERLTGSELLQYVGILRGLDADIVADRSKDLLEVLALNEAANKLIVDYSQGMRKKISLAAALIHAPKILLLDEPFESVDPVAVRVIQSVLRRLVDGGATVILSSHVMATVEDLCQHVAIMNQGRVVVTGPIDEVRAGGRLDDAFARAVGAEVVDASTLSWLQGRTPVDEPPMP